MGFFVTDYKDDTSKRVKKLVKECLAVESYQWRDILKLAKDSSCDDIKLYCDDNLTAGGIVGYGFYEDTECKTKALKEFFKPF